MKVRYSYLPQQFANCEDLWRKLRDFVSTGDFTLGKPLTEFEKSFAELIGTKYAIGVNSGTDAIKLPLKALGIGPGDEVITDDKVIVHYTGWLEDGCIFDSSYIRGETASFRIGRQKVIKGWDEGIPGMKIGGIRRLEIGSKSAYGERGIPGTVPENATLIFLVELVDIKRLVQK